MKFRSSLPGRRTRKSKTSGEFRADRAQAMYYLQFIFKYVKNRHICQLKCCSNLNLCTLSLQANCLWNLSNYVSIISIVVSTPTLNNNREKEEKKQKRKQKACDKSSTFLVCPKRYFMI